MWASQLCVSPSSPSVPILWETRENRDHKETQEPLVQQAHPDLRAERGIRERLESLVRKEEEDVVETLALLVHTTRESVESLELKERKEKRGTLAPQDPEERLTAQQYWG